MRDDDLIVAPLVPRVPFAERVAAGAAGEASLMREAARLGAVVVPVAPAVPDAPRPHVLTPSGLLTCHDFEVIFPGRGPLRIEAKAKRSLAHLGGWGLATGAAGRRDEWQGLLDLEGALGRVALAIYDPSDSAMVVALVRTLRAAGPRLTANRRFWWWPRETFTDYATALAQLRDHGDDQ